MAFKQLESEYAIPRGRVFFNPRGADGKLKGERPLGNCPEVTISISSTKAEHFSSETRASRRDRNRTVRVTRAGKLTVDNLDSANRAMILSGTLAKVSQTAETIADEQMDVVPGCYYQLGATEANPIGARLVSDVVLSPSGAGQAFELGKDYALDAGTGRIQILEGGAITAAKIKAAYKREAAKWERIETGPDGEVSGALRVVSDMVDGKDRDHYMPSVTLTPSGDFALVNSEEAYMEAEFDLDVLEPANGPAIYCDGRAVAG